MIFLIFLFLLFLPHLPLLLLMWVSIILISIKQGGRPPDASLDDTGTIRNLLVVCDWTNYDTAEASPAGENHKYNNVGQYTDQKGEKLLLYTSS